MNQNLVQFESVHTIKKKTCFSDNYTRKHKSYFLNFKEIKGILFFKKPLTFS